MDETADISGHAPTREPERADAELAARAREGDKSAFQALFLLHKLRVPPIASRLSCQREQVDEVGAHGFTKAYYDLADSAGSPDASFAAWLARIALNVS